MGTRELGAMERKTPSMIPPPPGGFSEGIDEASRVKSPSRVDDRTEESAASLEKACRRRPPWPLYCHQLTESLTSKNGFIRIHRLQVGASLRAGWGRSRGGLQLHSEKVWFRKRSVVMKLQYFSVLVKFGELP